MGDGPYPYLILPPLLATTANNPLRLPFRYNEYHEYNEYNEYLARR